VTTFRCVEAKAQQGSLEIAALDAKIRSIGEQNKSVSAHPPVGLNQSEGGNNDGDSPYRYR
jgi:hypothetical protein